MRNTMMENKKSFTNISVFFSEIMVPDHDLSNHDLRKEINIIAKCLSLFSVLVFDMKLLVILEATAGKTIIKESHSDW